jgi:hypothetical protein
MFKRAKGLPHVVQFTQRGVELLGAQGDLRLLHTGAFAALPDIQDEQQDDDDGERDQGNDHGWAKAKKGTTLAL